MNVPSIKRALFAGAAADPQGLRRVDRGAELGLALLVVAVIALLIVPLPTWAIDLLLSLNIAISIAMLTAVLYVPSISAMSSFPSMLLFSTLFRTSMNIASTKAILLNADAGHIIESFGQLVVGGNIGVGIVVYSIIAIVQFVVIAKGSERVAEVGARFTLDAMPGKQMSIDADLRAGNIEAEEAQHRRNRLATESQLHGGMDGAMKFVKGDAIAGIVITLVNIIGGIIIGMTYHDMELAHAANRFVILSIGDAMVSQIPSLLISVAAGVLITRVDEQDGARTTSIGPQIFRQLTGNSRAVYLAAGLLLCFAAIPGLPTVVFVGLAVFMALLGWRQQHSRASLGSHSSLHGRPRKVHGDKCAPYADGRSPFASPLEICISPAIHTSLALPRLQARLKEQMHQLEVQFGVKLPDPLVCAKDDVATAHFEVLIHDVPCGGGEISGGALVSENNETRSAEELLAHSVARVVTERVHMFVGIQETQWLLDQVQKQYPQLVAELHKVMPLNRTAEILRRLLEEKVPVRDVRTIFESLVTWGPKEKDLLMLAEYVRVELGRGIAYRALHGRTSIKSILLDLHVEQVLRQAIKQTPGGNYLALPPDQSQQLVDAVHAAVAAQQGQVLALVTSMDLRRYVRRLMEPKLPNLSVYSFQELGEWATIDPIARISF